MLWGKIMGLLKNIWVDSVWSQVIAGFIILAISAVFLKLKFKPKIINPKKAEPFVIEDIKPIQKANHPCIQVKFSSDKAIVEFQKNGGKLVGCSGLIGWVREDCPILQKYMKSWKFKIKRLFSKRKSLPSSSFPQITSNPANHSAAAPSTDTELDKTEERILKYLNGSDEADIGEFAGYMPEIPDSELNFYIEELVKGKYIKKSRKFSRIWLDDKGKQYLIDNKLINP